MIILLLTSWQVQQDLLLDDNPAITLIQTFTFDDDSDIDVVLGTETITLHYEEDLDGLATVSVDRIGVPKGGEVHVTVSDFRLNLDPTGEDAWVMHTDGTLTSLVFGADRHRPTTTPTTG